MAGTSWRRSSRRRAKNLSEREVSLNNDLWQIAGLEFEGSLYRDDKPGPAIPADMLRKRLTTGHR
jgi:hypothetical protein